MDLFRVVRTMILGVQPMATLRLSSWVILYDISALYKIQHAAENMGLRGWVMVSTKGRLEADLEGPRADLEKLLHRIKTGQLTGKELPLEHAWSLCRNRYNNLRLRLPEMIVHTRGPKSIND
jgi:acylphosphatase